MSDTDEPTAWEELGPAKTGSVLQLVQPSPHSGRRQPATEHDFRTELTACLALVAPAGMTEEARRDWFIAAGGTLRHLPADLLKQGCAKARQLADHPAKIVPIIIEDTREQYEARSSSPESEYLSLPPPNWQDAEAQFAEWEARLKSERIPQAEIDDKPERWRRIAWNRGLLTCINGEYSQRTKQLTPTSGGR